MTTANIVCWHCGQGKTVEFDGQIQLGVDLVTIAQKIGMKGVFDFNRNRVLVFCNDECMKEELTKNRVFRKYAKGVKKDVESGGVQTVLERAINNKD